MRFNCVYYLYPAYDNNGIFPSGRDFPSVNTYFSPDKTTVTGWQTEITPPLVNKCLTSSRKTIQQLRLISQVTFLVSQLWEKYEALINFLINYITYSSKSMVQNINDAAFSAFNWNTFKAVYKEILRKFVQNFLSFTIWYPLESKELLQTMTVCGTTSGNQTWKCIMWAQHIEIITTTTGQIMIATIMPSFPNSVSEWPRSWQLLFTWWICLRKWIQVDWIRLKTWDGRLQ